ncbi:hypothetical protein MUK42_16816 [Musa troglodytarum]|uniref:Uncharacterized protein n=1 Tax=Musa troglodytarum TaxID=320322 RepID=A0A9E7HGL6_9LILI|nr:hypothetical protein MUK42_16816 [Musa troglodytarum]
MEVEDDVFFADLSKRMALLIMEDEEESPAQCPTLPVQELPCMPQMSMLPPHTHEVAYRRRESKGTGVFIPLSAAPRRKNRPRRSTAVEDSSNPQRQHQLGKSVAAVASHATNANLIYPHQCSKSSVLKRVSNGL